MYATVTSKMLHDGVTPQRTSSGQSETVRPRLATAELLIGTGPDVANIL